MSSHELPPIDEDLLGSVEEIRKRSKDYFKTAISILLKHNGDQQLGRKIYNRAYELDYTAKTMWAIEIVTKGENNCDPKDYEKAQWIIWLTKVNKYTETSLPSDPRKRSCRVDLSGRIIPQPPPSDNEIEEFVKSFRGLQEQVRKNALEKFSTPDGKNMTLEEFYKRFESFPPEADH